MSPFRNMLRYFEMILIGEHSVSYVQSVHNMFHNICKLFCIEFLLSVNLEAPCNI